MKRCFSCGEDLGGFPSPSRQDTCPRCNAYVRCCRNCRFYDQYAHNSCREPQAEWVQDKEQANFCEYFELCGASYAGGESSPRSKFGDLFRKKPDD